MIRRIARFVSQDKSGLHGAAFVLGVSSFASGLLGLVRDRIFAQTFGAGVELDIYYAAFRVPDFLFVTIASFVSMTVLIPILVRKLGDGKREEAAQFLSQLLTLFCGVMVFVSALVWWWMPDVSLLVAPGFSGESREMHILLSRILLLSPFFLGISNLLGSVTQSLGRFGVYALSPIVYNASIIFGVVAFYPIFGLKGLVFGVILGALLHGVVQIPTLLRAGFSVRPSLVTDWREMRKVVMTSLPRTVGLATGQLVMIVLVALASKLATGSITIFNFAYNIQSFALSLVGVSYSVAAFPKLSEHAGNGQLEQFAREVSRAERQIVGWSLLGLLVCVFFAEDLIVLLLGSAIDPVRIASVFNLFMLSVWAQGIILLYTRSFYAAGETVKPVLANMACAAVTVWVALEGAKRYGDSIELLALAFSVGMLLNVLLQWFLFRQTFSIK